MRRFGSCLIDHPDYPQYPVYPVNPLDPCSFFFTGPARIDGSSPDTFPAGPLRRFIILFILLIPVHSSSRVRPGIDGSSPGLFPAGSLPRLIILFILFIPVFFPPLDPYAVSLSSSSSLSLFSFPRWTPTPFFYPLHPLDPCSFFSPRARPAASTSATVPSSARTPTPSRPSKPTRPYSVPDRRPCHS